MLNQAVFGRPGGNRTHKASLGGRYYFHLITDPYSIWKILLNLGKSRNIRSGVKKM